MGAVMQKLLAVQKDLKAPKNQYNSFGKYKYRSCEDILQAARPLCNDNGCVLTLSDEIVVEGSRFYVKATAAVIDIETDEKFCVSAYAREEESKKGMDGAQVTGTSSSYARKYALCALFAIDDTKDADTDEYAKQEHKAVQQTAKQNNPNGLTDNQRKALFAKLNEICPDKSQQKEVCAQMIGHEFETAYELTQADFKKFMDEASRPADSPF